MTFQWQMNCATCMRLQGEVVFYSIFTGTLKHHNVCEAHTFLDTGFKQTERAIFLYVIPNGIQIGTAFKCIFEATVPKLEILTRKTLTRICCVRAIFLSLVKHTQGQHYHSIQALVGLFGTSYHVSLS